MFDLGVTVELPLAFAIAFAVAIATAPVGVSGAVFLVPVQISVLGTASQAVAATNLLYNLIAIPGPLLSYRQRGRLWSRMAKLMVLGTVPGMAVGVALRVTAFSGSDSYLLLVAAVLASLGLWLLFRPTPRVGAHTRMGTGAVISASAVVGVIGGIYGIGGGGLLAPILVGAGFAVAEVAPAALLTTLITSAAGLAFFFLASAAGAAGFLPEWPTALALGLGGLSGGYAGAVLQPRLPERALRHLLAVVALGAAAFYLLRSIS